MSSPRFISFLEEYILFLPDLIFFVVFYHFNWLNLTTQNQKVRCLYTMQWQIMIKILTIAIDIIFHRSMKDAAILLAALLALYLFINIE